jgi:hypothetical protein
MGSTVEGRAWEGHMRARLRGGEGRSRSESQIEFYSSTIRVRRCSRRHPPIARFTAWRWMAWRANLAPQDLEDCHTPESPIGDRLLTDFTSCGIRNAAGQRRIDRPSMG